MSSSSSAFTRDANRVPITTLGLTASKTITFDGSTGTGAVGSVTLFTVTGTVAVNVFGICTTNLAGASATVEVGTASSTAAICNQQTATDVDAHMVWHDAVLAVGGQVAGHTHPVDQNISLKVATQNVTGGAMTFYCTWTPLSSDGNVVAA